MAQNFRTSIEQRIDAWLWRSQQEVAGPRAAVLHVGRLAWAVARDITAGQLTLRAMSLVYTTLLSLVPLLAISFSVLKGFGVHNQIEPFLLEVLAPLGERGAEIAATVVRFVDNTEVGVLGALGVALLFYTVISLMQKIESAFNEVWQINDQRSFTERLRDYITVLVIGPVLVFASLGITATVAGNEVIAPILGSAPLGWLFEIVGRLLPVLMVIMAFTCVYMFVPNTRVQLPAALAGAVFAGTLWNLASMGFAAFVAGSSNITAIYSSFATPILFMLWLYLGWMILLTGAAVAFYQQCPEYRQGRQTDHALTEVDRLAIGLQALRRIGQAFYAGQPPPGTDLLAREATVPGRVITNLLEGFRAGGLIAETAVPEDGWLPARPWEDASVFDALEILRCTSPALVDAPSPPLPIGSVAGILERLTVTLRDTFATLSLRDLALADDALATGVDEQVASRASLSNRSG